MFNKGDKVIYGQTGVCVVEDIAERELIKNVKRLYYKLRPLYQQNNIIYAPAESDKVFIRSIISREEAELLIKKIPDIYKEVSEDNGDKTDEDKKPVTCEELAAVAVKIHRKKLAARKMHKRLGFIDEKNLEHAEEMLFGELATVLELDINEIPDVLFGSIKE
ncbi:MAG: CarD family transcriptional regulator [Acutalibacteraceae bacterium]|nr:CarD family transcriptional regulator [Acutalibacteraceae bacterium]